MKTKVFLGIGIRIIVLFSIGMLMSYVPDNLREFFNDTLTSKEGIYKSLIDSEWDWGARHYWYHIMCIFLFLLALVNVIVGCVNLVEDNYEL